MVTDEQTKLTKEFEAWGKLGRKLARIQAELRSGEVRASAARKACTRAIHGYWNTIYQIRNAETIDLDRLPVSPYRVNPVTGEARNLEDPKDILPEGLGIVITNYESNEDKIRRLIQELTQAD